MLSWYKGPALFSRREALAVLPNTGSRIPFRESKKQTASKLGEIQVGQVDARPHLAHDVVTLKRSSETKHTRVPVLRCRRFGGTTTRPPAPPKTRLCARSCCAIRSYDIKTDSVQAKFLRGGVIRAGMANYHHRPGGDLMVMER